MIERVVGAGHAQVVVTAEMDQRKVDETEELYDKDKIALRSESRVVEGSAASTGVVGGIAGAQGNLPGAPAPTATPGPGGANQRLQETKNYEVNRVVRRTVGPDAMIKRLHVAVLVDNAPPAKAGAAPVPRTQQELDQISALARESAGLDAERGDKLEVRNVPFSPPSDEGTGEAAAAPALPIWQQPSVLAAAGGGALLVIAALFFLLRGKKRGIAALVLPAPVGQLEAALAAAELTGRPADAQRLALAERAIHERVVDVVRSEPARAARVLSSWLSEEPGRKSPS
jgi:flagellar M-ring protein FliF